jgi:hypothetical protein
MSGLPIFIERLGILKLKSYNMNKVADVKLLFRTINDGLSKIEEMPMSERARTLQSLREINEELCDYVVEMVKYVEKGRTNAK